MIKKIKNLTTFFLIFINIESKTQVIYYPNLYHAQAALSTTTLPNITHENVYQTAALSTIKTTGFTLIGFNKYGLPNVFDANFVAFSNFKNSQFAININSQQSPTISTYQYRFVVAKSINEVWSIGIGFNYFQMILKTLSINKNSYYVEFNNQFKINEHWKANININNPIGAYIDKIANEKIARTMSCGIAYTNNQMALTATIFKEEKKDLYMSLSAWYTLKKAMFGLGYISDISKPYIYTKYLLHPHFNISALVDYHNYLGFSSGVAVEYLL